MGRAPMGDEGRTVKATLRISKQEERLLTDEFGSSGRGLRALVDRWWARPEPPREHTAHPMLDDEIPGPPMLSDVEYAFRAQVGASVPLMGDDEMAAALALDRVTQSLPPIDGDAPLPGTIAAGVDSPDLGPTGVAAPVHRHRRGALIETRWLDGAKVRTYACSAPGCPVVLS